MRSATRIDWLEEFTCFIIAWKSNLDDTRGLVQRLAVDYSYVSLYDLFYDGTAELTFDRWEMSFKQT